MTPIYFGLGASGLFILIWVIGSIWLDEGLHRGDIKDPASLFLVGFFAAIFFAIGFFAAIQMIAEGNL